MTIKTIERVTHVPNSQNIQGLDGEGFERNRIADSVGTRVIYNSEWSEYQVYFYIDEVRYPDGDYFTSDKAEAVACAKTMRSQGAN